MLWSVSDVCRKVGIFLEEQCSHASHFALLLHKDFKVLVDDGHSQEDSCTRTDGPKEVRHDRQSSYTETAKGSSCGDVPAKKYNKYSALLYTVSSRHEKNSAASFPG